LAHHRWLYHRPDSILGDAHRIHHDAPRTLLAMPWFITTAAIFGLWYLGACVARISLLSAGIAGWLAGSVWYSVLYHSHHQWDIRIRWLRRLRTHHRIHHRFPTVNFGVTMRLWDSAVGTRYRRPR
jgi:sterol desaturase/sphingolipid hydroxylase (fatty acid hydroxylase superfamily)